MTPDSTPTTFDELCGPVIRAVYQTYQRIDDWLDQTDVFFALEPGFVFPLGASDSPLFRRQLPDDTSRLDTQFAQIAEQVAGRSIECVFVEDPDDWDSSVSPRLSNGCWVRTVMTAPHGTGGSGLFIDPSEAHDVAELTPFVFSSQGKAGCTP
ncbi:MAG: hypothetical protein ACIAXF_06715 [Phycisphaerales bacterium JB063]